MPWSVFRLASERVSSGTASAGLFWSSRSAETTMSLRIFSSAARAPILVSVSANAASF